MFLNIQNIFQIGQEDGDGQNQSDWSYVPGLLSYPPAKTVLCFFGFFCFFFGQLLFFLMKKTNKKKLYVCHHTNEKKQIK